MNAKVLVVDDESSIRSLIEGVLQYEGYDVTTASDGREGLRTFFGWHPSLVVLDVMMPKMDGWQLLDRIREVSDTPVVMLSALGQEHNTVRGLRSGADDYIVKPFRPSEFVARVETALRKAKAAPEPQVYQDTDLHVDFLRHHVYYKGAKVDLSAQEFRLLGALVRNAGLVMSSDRLLDTCWGEAAGGPENVRVYIGHLRKKLGDNPKQACIIETVREFGYRYCPAAS